LRTTHAHLVVIQQSDSKYLQAYIISVNPITEVKLMPEVQAVKDLDKVKLISHLLERRYRKQINHKFDKRSKHKPSMFKPS